MSAIQDSIAPLSWLQTEVEQRKQCYQECIVRRVFLKADEWGFNSRKSWTEQPEWFQDLFKTSICKGIWDRALKESPGKNFCELLRRPFALGLHRYAPADYDTSIFHAIARIEVFKRVHAGVGMPGVNEIDVLNLLGTSPPVFNPDSYWHKVLKDHLEHLNLLKDTADFHANYLLRLLYLYGSKSPIHTEAIFPDYVESYVTDAMLGFKYIDEPFSVSDVNDGKRLREALMRANIKFKTDNNKPISDDDKNVDASKYREEMTFWSENHFILFATAEYLAGQLLPERLFRAGYQYRTDKTKEFRSGGYPLPAFDKDRTGLQHMAKAKPRILRWLNERLKFGFSEWNSPGYYNEDLTALFNLVDFCLDEEIKTRSMMVLDVLIFDLARFTNNGSFGTTAGRAYFEHKNCGWEQSVGDLIEILFGTREGVFVDSDSPCAGALATTTYRVPDVLLAIGQDKPSSFVDRSRVSVNFDEAHRYGVYFDSDDDILFWLSKGTFLNRETLQANVSFALRYGLYHTAPFDAVIDFANLQWKILLTTDGAVTFSPPELDGSALTRANLYTYRNAGAMLSSAQSFRHGQTNAQSQLCQATLSMSATVWPTHPSNGGTITILYLEADNPVPITHDGPNWWTGSVTLPHVVQRGGAAIIAYQPTWLQRQLFQQRTHAWFPKNAFDGKLIQRRANDDSVGGWWTCGRKGNGYVALYSAKPVGWPLSQVTNATGESSPTGQVRDPTGALVPNVEMQPFRNVELLAAEDGRNVFILQIGCAEEFDSFEKFVDAVVTARINVSGLRSGIKHFECSYDIPDNLLGKHHRLELHYDENKVQYRGAPFSDDSFPRFENIYIKNSVETPIIRYDVDLPTLNCGDVYWNQYWYTIKHDTHSLTHDFRDLKRFMRPGYADRTSYHVSRVEGDSPREYDYSLLSKLHVKLNGCQIRPLITEVRNYLMYYELYFNFGPVGSKLTSLNTLGSNLIALNTTPEDLSSITYEIDLQNEQYDLRIDEIEWFRLRIKNVTPSEYLPLGAYEKPDSDRERPATTRETPLGGREQPSSGREVPPSSYEDPNKIPDADVKYYSNVDNWKPTSIEIIINEREVLRYEIDDWKDIDGSPTWSQRLKQAPIEETIAKTLRTVPFFGGYLFENSHWTENKDDIEVLNTALETQLGIPHLFPDPKFNEVTIRGTGIEKPTVFNGFLVAELSVDLIKIGDQTFIYDATSGLNFKRYIRVFENPFSQRAGEISGIQKGKKVEVTGKLKWNNNYEGWYEIYL